MRTIISISGNTLGLDSPLNYTHRAGLKTYPGAKHAIDISTEVAMVSSNVLVAAEDGPAQYDAYQVQAGGGDERRGRAGRGGVSEWRGLARSAPRLLTALHCFS